MPLPLAVSIWSDAMRINAKYYIGVDGGGTSCRARIQNEKGQVLGEAKTGSANILLGCDLAMDSIQTAIWQAAQQAKLTQTDFQYASVGLALAAAEQKSAWQSFMSKPHPYQIIQLNTDAYGACLGAWQGHDGAIFIAGTGSVGLLIKNGQQTMIGGREFPISDHGGGAIMGLSLIQKTLWAHDNFIEKTALTDAVLAHFHNNLDNIVAWSKTAKPCDYGQFSRQIFYFAKKNDAIAHQLLNETATYIEMGLTELHQQGADKICLMGGIGERILPWLSQQAKNNLVSSQGDAMDGALQIAQTFGHNLY